MGTATSSASWPWPTPRSPSPRSVQLSRNSEEVGDRNLKREGYGIARVDKAAGQLPSGVLALADEPNDAGAAQYAGWPYTLPFAEA